MRDMIVGVVVVAAGMDLVPVMLFLLVAATNAFGFNSHVLLCEIYERLMDIFDVELFER